MSCSRTQRRDAGVAQTRSLCLESSTLPQNHCAPVIKWHIFFKCIRLSGDGGGIDILDGRAFFQPMLGLNGV